MGVPGIGVRGKDGPEGPKGDSGLKGKVQSKIYGLFDSGVLMRNVD